MDAIGWYIATLHSMIGHEAGARWVGVDIGDRADCVLCAYEADPTPGNRAAVIAALQAAEPGDGC